MSFAAVMNFTLVTFLFVFLAIVYLRIKRSHRVLQKIQNYTEFH